MFLVRRGSRRVGVSSGAWGWPSSAAASRAGDCVSRWSKAICRGKSGARAGANGEGGVREGEEPLWPGGRFGFLAGSGLGWSLIGGKTKEPNASEGLPEQPT